MTSEEKKWVVGSQGFKDSLAFLKTLYDEELAVTPAEASMPTSGRKSSANGCRRARWEPPWKAPTRRRSGRRAATTSGPDYAEDMGVAKFPTQNGQEPGGVSMSGGWTLAVGADTKNPDLAFEFLSRP